MKLKRIYLSVTCLVVLLSANGQHVPKLAPAKFQSSLQTGLSIGQKGSKPAWLVNTVNGLQYKNWFAGIGLGIDYYGLKRTVPLFLDVQKNLSVKQNTLFWYVSGGYSIPWVIESHKPAYANKYEATGGLLYEAGAGYKFSLFNKTKLGLSAGYSFKQLKEQFTPPCNWCELEIPPPQTNSYQFRRIVIKVNWWLL
ncbi:MAG: hypothetical protein JWR61_5134 [Ferruginibacter sp.]|uniref:hypothetical protein n=1 Tax=Ferruginibacter sp. TaxID=1940288 RepID=UPI00265936F9|nr:hypothetical protein [Ferruginibacter sp.]MDB5280179.1 hypothetical protein [Ferruginibacter sp.]